MAETRDITCPFCLKVLGTCEKPDGTSEKEWARTLSGYRCGPAKERRLDNAYANLNANSIATVTPSVDVCAYSRADLIVNKGDATENHDVHVVTIQESNDEIAWNNTDHSVTGLGDVIDADVSSFQFVRLKVTTRQGASSRVDVDLGIRA